MINTRQIKRTKLGARALRWGVAALLLFVASGASAYDFSSSGIYYNILSGEDLTCEVTYGGTSSLSALYSGSVNIPETVTHDGTQYSVTEIGSSAFYRCTGLTEVTIPSSVTRIGWLAFYGCSGLTEVNFNATACTYAGSNAINTIVFGGCDNITTFNFGENVTIIPNYLCYNLTSLTSELTIPNGVTSIGSYAFYNCSGLTGTLTIPDGITTINKYTFYGCSGLTGELTIPNSVTEIGSYAFYYCKGLTGTLTIPDGITTINNYTFSGCSGLTSVTIPNSVTEIGNAAFSGCSRLAGTLTIPNSVTTIGDYTFRNCSGLTEVTIPNSVATIGSCTFSGCSGLTSVTIPNSVTTIGGSAFEGCTGLTEITIPNSVTEIGNYAFYNCSGLTSVAIGYRVTSIGNYAFFGTSLKEIYSKNSTPPDISAWTFDGVDKNTCILYVPINSKNAYSTADYWSEFINIEEMNFDDVLIAQTYEATEVTTSSALLRGVVTAGDEEVLEQGFEYWAEGGEVQTITSPDLIMAVTLTGLEDGVTYTYRAYATTESGTSYSEEMTFTTIKAPTVQTYEVTEITENSALLKGYVTAGNEDLLGQGFEYWAAGGEVQTIAMADQIMAATITGLNEGTTYTCRAYAKTASGTTYGEEVTFTTLGTATITPPTVQTYAATDVTENSATLNGVVAAGSEKVTEQGFEYWSSSNDVQTVASTSSSMSVTVANLKSSTTYTYRAYATTASGTTYGENVSFTTLEDTDGVSGVNAGLEEEAARYTTDGKKISKPQRGINIVRYSDGTTRKVLMK